MDDLRKGWRNLLAATIGLGLGVASYSNLSSLFFRPLEAEFGWSKAVAAGALIALPLTAIALPFVGWLIDRLGVRIVSGFSVLATMSGFLWLTQIHGSPKEYYAAVIVLNVLGCATGPVAYTRLVAAQFDKGRGLALATAQVGIALMGVILPPVVGGVIEGHGWRGGYSFLAGAALIGGICAQILMQPGRTATPTTPQIGLGVGAALKTATFWVLGLGILFISISTMGLVAQIQSVAIERGIDPHNAPWLLSLMAMSVIISRLIIGRLLDLPRPALGAALAPLIAAVGAAAMLLGPPVLAVTGTAVALIGFSVGAELDVMSFFCARLFGLKRYSAIYGLLSGFFYSGIAIGGISYGAIHDRTGNYNGALLFSTVLLVLAAALFTLLNRIEPAPQPVQAETMG
jgi:MFS family permease